MKVIVPGRTLRSLLRSAQNILWAGSAVSLVYVGWVLADTWLYQREQGQLLNALIEPAAEAPRARSISKPAALPGPSSIGLIGRLDIPRLGVSVMVAEGVSRLTLRRAVGHIPGTPLPGELGNSAFSGHRDTFFRPLKDIRARDLITVTTPLGEYRYRVVSTQVVAPSETAVLDNGEGEVLTLVTCYPFYFVGAAPERFVVRAERVS
jgi:sortase A